MSELRLVEQDAPGFERTREAMVWNGRKPDRRPDAIAQVRDAEQVIAALDLACRRGWKVSVRSGGHNFVGASVRDGGLLIDVSRMSDVAIDVEARTAAVQPGARSEDVMARLAAHGLAFGVGHCPTVALGGFLLGGGMGFNTGAWGFGTEQIVAIDVVTAAGELVRADAQHHADLFWAARGGGPRFFGVVVCYHLALQPFPAGLTSLSHAYPLSQLERIVGELDRLMDDLDPAVEPMGWIGKVHSHDAGPQPDAERVLLLNALSYGSSVEHARELLAPLESGLFASLADERTVAPCSFEDLFAFQRVLYPEGFRYAVDCVWTDEPPERQNLAALRTQMQAAPSDRTHCLWQLPFGNYRGAREDMAAGDLGRYYIAVYTAWEHAADDERNISWLRTTMEPLAEIATGHYPGDVDLLAAPTRSTGTLPESKRERFEQIRGAYDPDGLFQPPLGVD